MQNTLQTFKTEIETIKGILLNHRNFSSAPASSSGMNLPKIPSWQLSSKSKNEDKHSLDDDKHSNSSENDTEIIAEEPQNKRSTNSDSDSSLEKIEQQ